MLVHTSWQVHMHFKQRPKDTAHTLYLIYTEETAKWSNVIYTWLPPTTVL